ncbi:MAG: hypothetical protein NTU91_01995 [Chloroflexi bacterium]|nr:hypothetical protein [Chloroflexota bacterium]
MRSPRHVIVASAVVLIALVACRQTANLTTADLPTVDLPPGALPWPTNPGSSVLETHQAGLADSGFLYGENARWPEDIPADIPPLEGEIEVVRVLQGFQYRIDYTYVSEEALSQYLEDLEALGFEFQYIVWTAPNIPDEQTAEKIARGEWDAVDITKGPYRMRLEPGGEGVSLDIDNADFMTPGPPPQISPTPIVWPDDIPDRVPQPASCQMTNISNLGGYEPPAYMISFECSDPLVQEHFVEALLAAGLEETDRLVSDTGEIVEVTLQDNEIVVKAMSAWGGRFTFQIWGSEP